METWREMICLKSYGTKNYHLSDEITTFVRCLTTDIIPHDHISTLLTCRLVPLKKKDNVIRPVGAGEFLRQNISKTITRLLKEDTTCAAGIMLT